MKKIILAILALSVSLGIVNTASAGDIGIVLMHGKGGTARSGSPIGPLAEALESEGFLVVTPDMPWHEDRIYDKSYEDSMTEIDAAVDELKSQGAKRIVVGGHSLGANAAIGYGARRDGLAGILAIAPGHPIELGGYQAKMGNDWQRAKAMVDAGKGDQEGDFTDFNQGSSFTVTTKASIYLSWFDPNGPAVMPDNVARLKPGTPLMWIIGERDRMYGRGESYAFNNAPPHANNAYVVVKGGHKVTPKKGKLEILDWLNSL
jgi:pimeloyl-ACP methyl ester carboxylesterase